MSPEILAVCQQLIKSGKSVSVGLLKSRLPAGTPFPAIIQAVQYCKQQPKTVAELKLDDNEQPDAKTELTDAERISQLEHRVKGLEARLLQLETKV